MSKRRENIYKRKDGRWEGRYIKGRKLDGKVQFGYVYGKSYKTVQDKLIKMKYLYRRDNQDRQPYSGTVKQWLMYWLETESKNRVERPI